jgi:hypothetical protein
MTLRDLAERRDSTSRGAAALIEAGFAPDTRVADLRPGSVVRTLLETLAAEVARAHEQLGEAYESAFVETGTGESLELLVDRLERCRPWWRRLLPGTRRR